jgi:hypothetical protein
VRSPPQLLSRYVVERRAVERGLSHAFGNLLEGAAIVTVYPPCGFS